MDEIKEPTLFTVEDEPQARRPWFTPQEWEQMFKEDEETAQQAETLGLYYIRPPHVLLQRVEGYAQRMESTLQTALACLPVELQEVVINDYAALFVGNGIFKATPEQAYAILGKITPIKAFNIDRYGLYYCLLHFYSQLLKVRRDWSKNMKTANPQDTTEERAKYLLSLIPSVLSMADWRALDHLTQTEYITPTDFVGLDTGATLAFFKSVKTFNDLARYLYYYFVAKYCLSATPEELAQINTPPVFRTVVPSFTATEFAENWCKAAERQFDKLTKAVNKTFEATTTQEREQAITQAEEQANAKPIPLHETLNIIQSRPVDISPNGLTITDTKSIQRYIDEFNRKHPDYAVTMGTVHKVLEGVNLLPTYLKGRRDGEQISYDFTISKFAEIVGYGDANQEEKRALTGAFLTLNNLYVVVNKSRKRTKTAIRVISIRQADYNEKGDFVGNITLDVAQEALSGKPTLLTLEDYQKMRKAEKGMPKARFNKQLLTKGHKLERDLLEECFDYSGMVAEAERTGGPQAAKATQETIWKHTSRDKKRVEKWFDDYQTQGILTYTRTQNTKGDWVYSWKLSRPIPADEENTQEPDEQ